MKGIRGRVASICGATGLLLLLAGAPGGAQEPAAQQTADWRVEFEAVCGTTDASMSFTVEELTNLIARCDKLAELIGAEDETVRRVYLRRLKMCRDLLAYILESKGDAPQAAPAAPQVITPATPPAP